MMIARSFEAISLQDLHELVASSVSERRDLEFKRDLPGGTDGELKEFLADVTSLANANGGDRVLGLEEMGGVATALPGVPSTDPDKELLRLENIIRDGVEPRLSGLRLRWIAVSPEAGVLLLRIPGSLAAPHRIRFKNSGRFYSRNSRGKYEMDTHELREAFTATEQLPVRFGALHRTAVAQAEGIGMPFSIDPGPRAVATIAPLGLFREVRDFHWDRASALAPVRPSDMSSMVTLEGVLLYSAQTQNRTVRSYALTHWSGYFDVAWAMNSRREAEGGGTDKMVHPQSFETAIVGSASAAVAKLALHGVEGPWVVSVTVSGIQGYQLTLGHYDESEPAWREVTPLPELVLDHLNAETLRPILHSFWLLFGVERPTK